MLAGIETTEGQLFISIQPPDLLEQQQELLQFEFSLLRDAISSSGSKRISPEVKSVMDNAAESGLTGRPICGTEFSLFSVWFYFQGNAGGRPVSLT